MNRDEITRKTSELSTIAHTTEDSKVEYWYARELMTYMGLTTPVLLASVQGATQPCSVPPPKR